MQGEKLNRFFFEMVSVIIPSYKPSDYLKECLDSLDKQTLPKNLFEVVIVLNGEKRPYYEQIEAWLKCLNLCVTLLHTEVPDVSNARNLGIQNSRGDQIAFIDDDDIISPNYLAGLFKLATSNSIVIANVKTFTDDLNNTGNDYISRAYERYKTDQSIYNYRSFLSSSCCKLIPRSILSDAQFDTHLKRGEDSLFMYSLSSRIRTVIRADESCIYYRRLRPYSASRSKRNFKSEICRKIALIGKYTKIYLKNIKQNNVALYLSRVIATVIN